MDKVLRIFIVFTTTSLAACANSGFVQLMAKDSGKLYKGQVTECRSGTCNMSINIDGELFAGVIVKATSNQFNEFNATQGNANISSPHLPFSTKNIGYSATSTSSTDGGTSIMKGLLSSSNGKGLRCEFTATGEGGAGTCIDDNKRVLDGLVYR